MNLLRLDDPGLLRFVSRHALSIATFSSRRKKNYHSKAKFFFDYTTKKENFCYIYGRL